MGGIRVEGSTSGNVAEVNSSNELKTALSLVPANIGGVRMFSENDDGSVTGSPSLRSPETSLDYRLRVGVDTLLFDATPSETSPDTTRWKISGISTMVTAMTSGFIVLNSGLAATVSGNYVSWSTLRHFRARGASQVYVEFDANTSVAPIANQVVEAGLFLPVAGVQPADGLWFQFTSAGIIGVMNYNGTVTQTGVLLANSVAVTKRFCITVSDHSIEFWVNNILVGTLAIPDGQASPFLTDALPLTFQQRNSGVVSGAGQASFKVGNAVVSTGDLNTGKSWAHQMAGMGHSGYQAQAGATMGTTALLPNATAATTLTGAAISQTVAIATGLGGQAGIIAGVAGADGLITAYQNPVGSVSQPPRNLTITGVKISAVNLGAAVATTASILQWSLAYGATALSLATADAVALTAATAKSHRRVPLGFSSFQVGAAIGAQAPDIVMNFDSPIVVHPGEYLCSVAKFLVGTATASQVIWANVTFDSHWD